MTDPTPGTVGPLSSPCWILDLPEPLAGSLPFHGRHRHNAQREAAAHGRDHETAAPDVRQLTEPCHVVICGCGYLYDTDETMEEHFADDEDARKVVIQNGWSADLRCPECREAAPVDTLQAVTF